VGAVELATIQQREEQEVAQAEPSSSRRRGWHSPAVRSQTVVVAVAVVPPPETTLLLERPGSTDGSAVVEVKAPTILVAHSPDIRLAETAGLEQKVLALAAPDKMATVSAGAFRERTMSTLAAGVAA
jgi:hypothetical protein